LIIIIFRLTVDHHWTVDALLWLATKSLRISGKEILSTFTFL